MILQGKVAYITGGSKGIGLGVAKSLLDQGMKVAISGRNKTSLDEAHSILGQDKNVMKIVSDVTTYDDEAEAVKTILGKWGQLDVVLANAGVGHFSSIDQMRLEDWNKMVDTNLTGAFYTLKASVDALKATEGYYMTLASLAGTNFFAQGAGYNATKFGVVGFTQAAMLDLRKFNIKVTTIMPGSVASFFNGNTPSEKDAWKIQPEDIGQMVIDLLRMPARTLPSKVEVRPSQPPIRK